MSQQYDNFELYEGCSSVSKFKSIYHNQKDVEQTPLLFDYDIKFYHLDLHIEKDTTYLSGNVKYKAQVTSSVLDTFALEFIDEMPIDSVIFNGSPIGFYRMNNEVFIPLTTVLSNSDSFECQVFYHGTPPAGEFFNGVSIGYDSVWNQSVVWTLSEPFNARQWWPVKQVLTDKADSVWVFLTTNSENKAGSIGILENEVVLPDSKVRHEWKSSYPIAYYLISYAVANYQEYNIYGKPTALNGDSILIQNYIYNSPGCLENYKTGIDRTSSMMEYFSDIYSMYPFEEEKYGHCLAELSGGMEHQTMTTLGYFGLGIVAHELAHMWFGDNVTCATWSDIWVNEGFATYSDYLAHQQLAAPQWPPVWLENAHNYITSEPGGSVYVPPEEVYYGNESRIFSGRLTYYKGAYVLHMIRYILNDDELFFLAMQNFQEAFQSDVATSEDFINTLNETTNMNFDEYFDQWFYGEGYPIYNIDWTWTQGEFEISSAQSPSAGAITPFFKMKYPVKLFLNNGTDTLIEVEHTQPFVIKSVSIVEGVDSIQVDPDLWVLKRIDSINAIEKSNNGEIFTVYPNPVSDRLVIKFDQNAAFLGSIYDMTGKQIRTFASEKSEIIIDFQSFDSGLYYLRLESGDFISNHKIIKH